MSRIEKVFWTLNRTRAAQSLTQNIETDVVIVGGGMAGLTAAQSFLRKGLRVVLLEKDYCGSGASGKSSGFITPNSELGLSSLIQAYGLLQAQKLWKFVTFGAIRIQENIREYTLDCDYEEQDTLIVANTQRAYKREIEAEYTARQQLGYVSSLYDHKEMSTVLGSHNYTGGIAYSGSFGIQSYRYCAGLKEVLQQQGVRIYENTPVLAIQNHLIKTSYAQVKAEHIVVCTDYAQLGSIKDLVYHVQTFLMLSAPLSSDRVKNIFPNGRYMVWDTDLVYHYYRLTPDNRLMIGGANLWDTYARIEKYRNSSIAQKLSHYIQKKFPESACSFKYIWPGFIGVSKDLLPLAGFDEHMPSVYYIAAATGLPWAAALGAYSAERIIENNMDFDEFFSPSRHFRLGAGIQKILGNPATFALSNLLTVRSF